MRVFVPELALDQGQYAVDLLRIDPADSFPADIVGRVIDHPVPGDIRAGVRTAVHRNPKQDGPQGLSTLCLASGTDRRRQPSEMPGVAPQIAAGKADDALSRQYFVQINHWRFSEFDARTHS